MIWFDNIKIACVSGKLEVVARFKKGQASLFELTVICPDLEKICLSEYKKDHEKQGFELRLQFLPEHKKSLEAQTKELKEIR